MKKIAILGSTGSIGINTLYVIKTLGPRYKIVGLACQRNIALLKKQIKQFHPRVVCVMDKNAADKLKLRLASRASRFTPEIHSGLNGLIKIATHPEVNFVVFALPGAICLEPILKAIKHKKQIALANKEALVIAGGIITTEAKRQGVKILPIDSEHSAIFQCLEGRDLDSVKSIILTASGGPFYTYSQKQLAKVSVKDALAHPTWRMGKKISVDSATLLNKGLEVMEAHWLFGIAFSRIKVIIHPQSIIHSMVEFMDGSIIAQLGITDMRLPIQYALTYPQRREGLPALRLDKLPPLTFKKLDEKRFPCFSLACRAGRVGGTMPAVLNAADEVVVRLFLQRKISFLNIFQTIAKVMSRHRVIKKPGIKDIFAADAWARKEAAKENG